MSLQIKLYLGSQVIKSTHNTNKVQYVTNDFYVKRGLLSNYLTTIL